MTNLNDKKVIMFHSSFFLPIEATIVLFFKRKEDKRQKPYFILFFIKSIYSGMYTTIEYLSEQTITFSLRL